MFIVLTTTIVRYPSVQHTVFSIPSHYHCPLGLDINENEIEVACAVRLMFTPDSRRFRAFGHGPGT